MIGAITPQTYTTSGVLEAEEKVTITLQGGSGLDLSAGGDRVKIVYAGSGSVVAACNTGSGVAQGTTLTSSMPLTDLPGSDSTEATEVVLSEVVFEVISGLLGEVLVR